MDKLTPKNLELLKAVITVMDTTSIDFDKVAEQTGQTRKYSRDGWALLRNKIVGDNKGNDAKTATPTKKSGTPKESASSKKGKSEATDKGEKGSAKKRAKKDSVVACADGDDDAEGEVVVKKEEGEFNEAGAIMDD